MQKSFKAPQGLTLGEISKPTSGKGTATAGGDRQATVMAFQLIIFWRYPRCGEESKAFALVPFTGGHAIEFDCIGMVYTLRRRENKRYYKGHGATPVDDNAIPTLTDTERSRLWRTILQGLSNAVAPLECRGIAMDAVGMDRGAPLERLW